MSAVYEVEILSIKDRRVRWHFSINNPDEERYTPTSKGFWLQVLIEIFYEELKGYIDAPLSREAFKALAEASPVAAQYKDWIKLAHSQEVLISEAQYREFSNDNQAFAQKYGISPTPFAGGTGRQNDERVYFYMTQPNISAIADLAAIFIADVQIVREDSWDDAEESPYHVGIVDMTVTVADLLHHLVVKTRLETSAYDFD